MSRPDRATSPFPWEAAMRIGIGLMRMSPEEFWAMTPRELDMAARILIGGAGRPPARRDLEGLMQRFPDGKD